MGCLAVLIAVGLFALGTLWLSTPSGQRWAIERILDAGVPALGLDGPPPRITIGEVKLNWSPFGLAAEKVMVDGPDANGRVERWLGIGSLVIRPADRSGAHWSLLVLEGVHIEPAGRDHILGLLDGLDTGTDSTAGVFTLDRLYMEDCSMALPDDWIDDGRGHTIMIERMEWRGLRWDQAAQWASGTGKVALVSMVPATGSIDTTLLSWAGVGWGMEGQCTTTPASWWPAEGPIPEWVSDLPGDWRFTLDGDACNVHLQGNAEWGSVEADLGMDGPAIRLDRADIGYRRIPTSLGIAMGGAGRLSMEGPVLVEVQTSDQDADGLPVRCLGQPTLSWTVEGGAARGSRVSMTYDLTEGTVSTTGQCALDPGEERTALSWRLTGSAPPFGAGWTRPGGANVALEGSWAASISGEGPGSGLTEGTLDLDVALLNGLPNRASLQASARSAPLRLGEGLELYGGWNAAGQCDLDTAFGLDRWWGRVDLTEARFIPLPGYDGSTPAGPPLSMRRFHVRSNGDAEAFTMDVEGDFAQGHVEGPLDPDAWSGPVLGMLESGQWIAAGEAPAGPTRTEAPPVESRPWQVQLTTWRPDLLERLSGGRYSIGYGSRIDIRHDRGELGFDLALSDLHVGPVRAKGVSLEGRGGAAPLAWSMTAGEVDLPGVGAVRDVAARADSITAGGQQLTASWSGPVEGMVSFEHRLEDGRHDWFPTQMSLSYRGSDWTLEPHPEAGIAWTGDDLSTLGIHHLSLSGKDGRITLDRADQDRLSGGLVEVRLDRILLHPFSGPISEVSGFRPEQASGLLHGSFQCGLEPMRFSGVLQWEDAALDGWPLGDICMTASWDGAQQVELDQFLNDREVLRAVMRNRQQFALDLIEWPLDMMAPVLARGSVDLQGHASGGLVVEVGGPAGEADISGTLDIRAPRLAIGAIGTEYSLEGSLNFNSGYIGMDQAILRDEAGQQAVVNLSVQHSAFDDWNYDLGLELGAPFVVMDLPPDPGALFNGRLIVTGEANVFGTADWMEVEARARSAQGTRFTMPLDALEGPELPTGIHFTGGTVPSGPAPEPVAPFDLSLALEVEVTPDAQLSMILDQAAGERVDGRANGALSLVSNRTRSLAMEGGLTIEEGQYRFSLRDLFSKNIAIEPGGRIDWDGNPYEAELGLRAIAPVWTSPAPLLPGMVQPDKTDVVVGMGIAGALSSPRLDFKIDFPTYELTDPTMLSQVDAVLNTPEEVERQAFALLATGQFIPPNQRNAQLIGLTAATQASDLLSTGVSELLSNLSDELDIGMRYLPSTAGTAEAGVAGVPGSAGGDNRSEDAFEMDLGLRLLNDRLRISGTLGAKGVDDFSLEQKDLKGAIDVRYILTADGRWELIGYSRPESDLEEEPRQGIGAVYQVRFDRLGDLFGGRRKEGSPP